MSEPVKPSGLSPCDEVQEVLLDYLNRELGPARSDFVREHVRRCERCRIAMSELSDTMAVLNLARKASAPDRLSPERRRLMHRAVAHPIVDWILRHNRVVAAVCTLFLLVVLVWVVSWSMEIDYPDNSDAIPVNLSGTNSWPAGRDGGRSNP